MKRTYPFGETVEGLLLETARFDFAWLVLADHLDETGQGDLARIIREKNWVAFRKIHEWLSESKFDPSKMVLVVQYRRRGKFAEHPGWIAYRTFYTRAGFPGIRVSFYRPNPTPSFLDPYSSEPCKR